MTEQPEEFIPDEPLLLPSAEEDEDGENEAEMSEDPTETSDDYEVIDLTEIDFRDAELIREIDVAMVDQFAYTTEAVKISEKFYVGRTTYKIKILPMSFAKRKLYRVRKKNLIYNGEAMRPGVRIPYTKEEFAALSRKQRKAVLLDAKNVLEYNRTCARIALVQVAKTDDLKRVEKLKRLEEQLDTQRSNLPVPERWKDCIKEK